MKFKVFEAKKSIHVGIARKPGFYFHVVSTNGKITLASEGYPTTTHAFRAVAQVWKSFGKALIGPGWVSVRPIRYTRDSLKPATRKGK